MNECPFRRMMNNTPTETEAKGFSRRWTYRTEMISEIDILIHQFPIMINRVDGYSVGRAGGFHSPAQTTSALRTVLDSNPSHGSPTQPILFVVPHCIGGLKALDPLPAPMCTPPRKQAAMLLDPFRIISHPL
jgi:hypothetical protein